jgi:alkylhydroperoxidase family enzyme
MCWWIKRRLAAFEARTGESADYVRDMLDHAPGGFWRFAGFLPLAAHHAALPKDAYHVARIVAMQQQDCGPCLQTVVVLAERDRVPAATLRATLEGRWAALPDELPKVADYTHAVVTRDVRINDRRQELVASLGLPAVTELALAIAAAQVFPTIKRAMGHGRSCAAVRIAVSEHVG